MLRLVGKGVVGPRAVAGAAVARKWIRITIAAAAGRHRVALLQAGISATTHARSDVGAAIVDRTCRCRRRRHRDKCHRDEGRGRRRGYFQKMLHLLSLFLSVCWLSAPQTKMGGREIFRHRNKNIVMKCSFKPGKGSRFSAPNASL